MGAIAANNLSIRVPPMTNCNYVNELFWVRDAVDDALISHADAPEILGAFQLHHARRLRIASMFLRMTTV